MTENEMQEEQQIVILQPETKKGLALTAIVLGAMQGISCCCFNFLGIVGIAALILGIISLASASKADLQFKTGDYYGCENTAKSANSLALVGFIISICAVAIGIGSIVVKIIFGMGFAGLSYYNSIIPGIG